jgi:Icc-related predicted phosphoesterase
MSEESVKDLIYLHGDNHGDWDFLFKKLEYLSISNCLLIGVGDAGVGFSIKRKQERQFELLNSSFKKRGIKYLTIRGNHDDPAYFDGSIKLSNFELIPDYTSRKINGETFLFVGGAVSVDRCYRREGVSYWPDETFVFKPELATECDVLVTHSAPTWIGPIDKSGIQGFISKDENLWEECCKERLAVEQLFNKSKPKKSYHGHFHKSYQAYSNGCGATILDINEFIEHKKHEL